MTTGRQANAMVELLDGVDLRFESDAGIVSDRTRLGYAAGLDPEAMGRLEWWRGWRAGSRAIVYVRFSAVCGWARSRT